MNMAKATKMTNFFGENRRECSLTNYQTLMTVGEEKRLKMLIEMPLSNKPVLGIPTWVSDPWRGMEKENSLTTRSNIYVMCEGMTIDFFSTEKIRSRALSMTGCKLGGFHLITTGEGEKKSTALHFTAYIPGSIAVRDWVWDNLRKTFFAEFAYSQTEMDFGSSDSDEDEEEDELSTSADDEVEAQPIAARGRRGAKKPFDPAAIQRAAGNNRPHLHQ
jgi:hypothetical protein